MINVLDPGLRVFVRVYFLQHKLQPFFKSGNNETAAACCGLSTDKCQHCVADSSTSFHAKGEENLEPVCPHGSASQCFPTHKLLKSFNSFIKERQNLPCSRSKMFLFQPPGLFGRYITWLRPRLRRYLATISKNQYMELHWMLKLGRVCTKTMPNLNRPVITGIPSAH